MIPQLKKILVLFSITAVVFPFAPDAEFAKPVAAAVSVSAVTVTVDTNLDTGRISLSSHANSDACQFEVQSTLSIVQDKGVVNLHQGPWCESKIVIAPVVMQNQLVVTQPVPTHNVKVVVHQAELNTVKVKTGSRAPNVAVLPMQLSGLEVRVNRELHLNLSSLSYSGFSKTFNYFMSFDQLHILRC